MRNALQLKKAIWAWLAVIWCATAFAAENSFSNGIESIPLKAIGYAVLLAFIGGLAATTTKIARVDVVIKSMTLEVFKDIVCSLVAGIFVFLLTSWSGISFWLQASLIPLAGYSGSRLLERGIEGGLFPWVDKIFGGTGSKHVSGEAKE